jgi:hypothetical protein
MIMAVTCGFVVVVDSRHADGGRPGRNVRASLHLDHLNFKEDEASHEREGSSSLKFR